MALPKRAASALTAADEVQDQRHQARAQAPPRREEVHEVDRPHVRDAGPVEPDGEEEEPQAEADEGGDQGGAGGAVLRGCCSWRRLPGGRCQSGHRAYRVADLHTSSAPTLALFFVRLLREGRVGRMARQKAATRCGGARGVAGSPGGGPGGPGSQAGRGPPGRRKETPGQSAARLLLDSTRPCHPGSVRVRTSLGPPAFRSAKRPIRSLGRIPAKLETRFDPWQTS